MVVTVKALLISAGIGAAQRAIKNYNLNRCASVCAEQARVMYKNVSSHIDELSSYLDANIFNLSAREKEKLFSTILQLDDIRGTGLEQTRSRIDAPEIKYR